MQCARRDLKHAEDDCADDCWTLLDECVDARAHTQQMCRCIALLQQMSCCECDVAPMSSRGECVLSNCDPGVRVELRLGRRDGRLAGAAVLGREI